jgi:prepilin-type N-terminal cleavage/methylation domain-containing protein
MEIFNKFRCRSRDAKQRGFTLPEFVISAALVSLVSGVMLGCLLFGGKMLSLSNDKLTFTSDIRNFENAFIHAVRTASDVNVGQGSASSFTPAVDSAQQGNAIQIYNGDNTNTYIRLFVDSADLCLKMVDSDNTGVVTMTDAITNAYPFWLEDISGTILTNDQYACVIGVLLQFSLGNTQSAAFSIQDYRQFSTRVTRRTAFGTQN